MARLSVLHAAKYYPPVPGGMETIIADLCAGTARDWDVRVVAAADGMRTVRERQDEVAVVRAASYGVVSSVPLCPAYPLELWRRPADCLVLHEPNPVAGASVFLRTPGRRLIVWHHSDLLRPWWAPRTYGRVQRALYRRADCVLVSSPNLAASSALVAHARRVEIVPFGIRLDRFQRADEATSRRAADLRASSPGPRILFVGRFVYYKGVEVLIDAMAQCDGTLLLAGDGPLEPLLRRRAAERSLGDRVRFLGRVPDADLPSVYRAADLFVLPSTAFTETFGVVQIEAMASGLPVISTNLPTGVPWVNQDGVSGLTVEPGNVDALAAAIRRLVGDPAERDRLARGAARRAIAHFSRERMLTTFRALVEEIVLDPVRVDPLAGARAS
jgi:rhamnosyl/mannosyltransferase